MHTGIVNQHTAKHFLNPYPYATSKEEKLLDPVQITALKQAVILVEIHEELVNGCEQVIRNRFSHNILEIISSNRKPNDFLQFSRLSDHLQRKNPTWSYG